MSFHVLLLDRAGNNLVNADFSPYSRMFFAVKHIYLTLYVVHTCRNAPIYSVPLYLAPLRVRVCTCVRARARVCGRVCAWARAWPRLLPLFASFYSPIMYILRRYARPARRVVRSAHSAANFFEIVCGPSISIPPSLPGVGDTT